MSTLYSVRFLSTSSGGVWTSYFVPDGTRAVVRAIDIANPFAVVSTVDVLAGPGYIWTRAVPAERVSLHLETRAVVYGGEAISVFLQTSQVYATVSGYLFEDVAGSRAPPFTQSEESPLAKFPQIA